MTAMDVYTVLWDVSLDAMRDATDMRRHAWERDVYGNRKHLQMPEEATTVNLARHIATGFPWSVADRATVVLHNRALEGGNNNQGAKGTGLASKADLELCIELAPGRYCDLVLQAKRLAVNAKGTGGSYQGWSRTNNRTLLSWAAKENRTPGMLLYNEAVPPFDDIPLTAFGLCRRARRRLDYGYFPSDEFGNYAGSQRYRPGYGRHLGVLDGTPAGISLCVSKHYMKTLTNPTPADIRAAHFPLEHLLHTPGCGGIATSGPWRGPRGRWDGGPGGTPAGGWPRPPRRDGDSGDGGGDVRLAIEEQVELKRRMPDWALRTLMQLDLPRPSEENPALPPWEDLDFYPITASIIIQLDPERR